MEVEPPGRRDLLREEAPDAAPVDPPDDLADEVAVEAGLLAVPGPRLPERRRRGEQPGEVFPVEERLGRLRLAEGEDPRLVGQQVADERPLLPGLRVFRPVAGDGRVQVEFAAFGEEERARGHERLRHRVGVRDRVLRPGQTGLRIGVSAPEIDDEPPVQVDGDGGPQLAPLREAALERLPDGREGRLAEAVNARAHRRSMPGNARAVLFSAAKTKSESGSRKALSLPVLCTW